MLQIRLSQETSSSVPCHGVTLLAPAGRDAALAAIGRQFHYATTLPLGALKARQPVLA
jgi:allophanate hydrolase